MNGKIKRLLTFFILLGLILPTGLVFAKPQAFAPPDTIIFINEIHYDNASTDAGEAVEIAGPAGTDLSGWSLVLYNGNGGAPYNTITMNGVIPELQNGYGTLFFDTIGLQNGSPDGMALVNPANEVTMFLSYEGTFTAVGGPADGLTSTDIGVSEGSSTPIGESLQLVGSGSMYGEFTWAVPQPATFGAVNTGQSFGEISNAPVLINCGDTIYLYPGSPATTEVTASDADGTVTMIEITDINPAASISISDFMPASAPGETATAVVNIGTDLAPGSYQVNFLASNDDAEPQTAACSLSIVINQILTIGEVQGVVTDTDDGLAFRSPYAPPSGNGSGEYVSVQGVITQKTVFLTSSGYSRYGFFVQNTINANDGDPYSSDGIYVYMDRYPTLRIDGGGYYEPVVGDEVLLRGPIVEYYNLTQLSNPFMVSVIRTGVDLSAEIEAFEANPPADLDDANRYWERHEGMRATLAVGSIIISPRDIFSSTMDAEVWLAHPESVIGVRENEYERRAFRDAHPLDDLPELFDNQNGYRIVTGAHGLKATLDDPMALLPTVHTFQSLTAPSFGGVYFSFNKYQIQVEQEFDLLSDVNPAMNGTPQEFSRDGAYNVVTFNLENLYDFRDDPFDGCDFEGNSGCDGVYPPFNYVPSTLDEYEWRVFQLARQIVEDLHNPDLLLIQEVEDQDICLYESDSLICGTEDNIDGQPDALQDLALVINWLGGPEYTAAYDRDGADDRGITTAFMFRSDKVQLLPIDENHPLFGNNPIIDYRASGLPYNMDIQNPKAFNAEIPADVDLSTGVDGDYVFTRSPQLGYFRVWRTAVESSIYTDLYAVTNHFSSGPDRRVGQRTEQAAYNAALADAVETIDPDAMITIGGDLNVFPRPDDPFTPDSTYFPSDQLAPLYNQNLLNLFDILVTENPASAYSYVYQGQAQTLDHLFVNSILFNELVKVETAHINADWTIGEYDGAPRGNSDHDPQLARFQNLVTVEKLIELVQYYEVQGKITHPKAGTILIAQLNKAIRWRDIGHIPAYNARIWAFMRIVNAYSPHFIDETTAQILMVEADQLLMDW